MTVEFALFLSPEGIALAHRQKSGHWALVAEARPEGDDLAAAMAEIKAAATARGGADAPVLLVLPDDQVLYTSFMAPANDPDLVAARIAEGLDGMTPYAVDDLVHDWEAVEEDRIKVAVVARETLDEATQFAASHGFKSAGIAAMPPAERFPAMPVFGDSAGSLGLDRGGLAFGSDDWTDPAAAAEEVEPVEVPPETTPDTSETPEKAAEAAPEDSGGLNATPADGPVAEAPAKAETAPEPDLEPAVQTGTDNAQDIASTTPVEAEDPPQPISDPTLDQPVAPLASDPEPEPEEDASPPEPVETATAPATAPPEPVVAPKPSRGKVDGKSQRPLTAERPDEMPARPSGAPALSAEPLTEVPGIEDAASAAGPVLGFAARRGKVPKPDAGGGDLVSARPSRLGFGAPRSEGETPPVLHPDAATGPAPSATPARPGHRLAAQLARVRDASRLSPTQAVAPPPGQRADLAPVEIPAADAMPDAAARDDAALAGGRFGFTRRRPGEASPPPSPPASSASAFSSGLLARKPVEAAGPSFKTGLILTLILLVLLALIAIWSALFLPDSPIARLFGMGDRDSAAAIEEPLDAPAPPLAITAPPAMGALDTGTAEPEATEPDVALADPEPEIAPAEDVIEAAPEELVEAAPEAAETEVVAEVVPAEPVLPDIDAELDLPPLPPLPEEQLPSLEETERIYAEDGIWPRTPERPTLAALSTSNEIYVASIDPEVPVTDAIALADPALDPGELLRRVPPPPPFGATPDRDARGLITPTPEGVLTPEGAFVVLGRPAVDAIPRPREEAPEAEVEAEVSAIDVENAILGTFRPTPRPVDLDETRERQVLGGFSTSELAALRPGQRPLSAQEAAAQASLFPQAGPTGEATPETPDADSAGAAPAAIEGTQLAVAASRLPAARPDNIEQLVAAAQQAVPAVVVAPESIARAPSIPSNADVTRAATERNAIRLRDINLIGVTGTPNDRRALVRLPSGRFVRVGVGDRLDGGRVAAIGENSLQYVRNGRNVTLEIPG